MKPDVYEYFKPPDEVLTKLVQVLAFQNGHRIRMTAHHKTVVQKYKAAKEEIKRLHDIIRSFQKKISILEHNMEELKKGSPNRQGSSSPVISPKISSQNNAPMRNSPNQRILMTPNRLTLQRQISPSNKNSSVSPSGFNISNSSPEQSFNKTSTPLNQSSLRLNLKSSSPQIMSPNTYISPVPAVTSYRVPKQYACQPSTPESPRICSTPVRSPALPESAQHIYGQMQKSHRQEVMRGTVNTGKRPEYTHQSMSPVSSYSLLRKNYSLQ